MGENSEIQWTDNTWNPWIGCTKVSPGCANCYAETYGNRFGVGWGPGKPRRRTFASNWRKPIQWDKQAKKAGTRTRVFCASLADWLDPEVDPQWRADLLALIYDTPNLDWLLLTKREEELKLLRFTFKVIPNIWLGVSAENQEQWDKRVKVLMDIDCVGPKFVSAEPLLGPIHMSYATAPDWLIVGGESGQGSRPMEYSWVRCLKDECNFRGTAFFFKQWGGVNKKLTGRLLDGREWNEVPA